MEGKGREEAHNHSQLSILRWNNRCPKSKRRYSPKTCVCGQIKQINERSRLPRPVLCVLFLCPEDYKMLAETVLLPARVLYYEQYILYKETCSAAGKKPLTSLEYRRSVVEALAQEHLQDSSSRPSAGHQRVGPTTYRLNRKLHLLDQRSTYRNCIRHVTFAKHAQNSQLCTQLRALSAITPYNSTISKLCTSHVYST